MKRAEARIVGTRSSIHLDDGEEYTMKVEDGQFNGHMDIYTMDQWLEHMMISPAMSGDRIESIMVFEDDKFIGDAVEDVITSMCYEHGLRTSGNCYYDAQELYPYVSHIFGFGNGDPSDSIDAIAIMMLTKFPQFYKEEEDELDYDYV